MTLLDDIQQITAQDVDTEALQQVLDAFVNLSGRLTPEIELRVLRLGENPTQAQINTTVDEIQELLEAELDDFAGYLNTVLPQYEQEAFQLGATHALLILSLVFAFRNIDQEPQGTPDAGDILGQMLAVGSPLYNRLQIYGAYHAEQIADALRKALASGIGTREGAKPIAEILRIIELAIANPLADALRLTRTALLYAYRESTRLNYIANSDVVSGWQWSAELDDRVCMSCVVMHGTIHSLDETLNDHHNGRCAMIPIVGEPIISTDAGIQWFNSLSEAQQKAMMGKGRFEAWKDGKFDLPDISSVYNDEVYGDMRRETPLKDLIK